MRLYLPDYLKKTIAAHASASYPREASGYLFGLWEKDGVRVHGVAPGLNRREQGDENHLHFNTDDVERQTDRAVRAGQGEVVGFYCCATDDAAKPTSSDREFARAIPGYVWLFAQVEQGVMQAPICQILDEESEDAAFKKIPIESTDDAPPRSDAARIDQAY